MKREEGLEMLGRAAELGLTLHWALALMHLAHHGATRKGDLSRVCHVTTPSTTSMVDCMLVEGLVEEGRCAGDRRVVWVRATANGLAVVERMVGK